MPTPHHAGGGGAPTSRITSPAPGTPHTSNGTYPFGGHATGVPAAAGVLASLAAAGSTAISSSLASTSSTRAPLLPPSSYSVSRSAGRWSLAPSPSPSSPFSSSLCVASSPVDMRADFLRSAADILPRRIAGA
eukprot:scaffold95369_cov25-Tisochrysis_lutea.AAC.3